jgi:uncharacterized protein (DUF302 family)
MSYYFNKTLALPFDEAVERIKSELKKEGFGVLTEIDVKKTLHERSGRTSGPTASSAPAIRPTPIRP